MTGSALMSLLIAMMLVAALGAVAVFAVRKAVGIRRLVDRLLPMPSVPAHAIEPRRCIVQGTLRATSHPLETFDGTPALMVRTCAGYVTQVGRTTYVRPTDFDVVASAEAVIEDAGGACGFDPRNAVVLGETARWEPDPATFANRLPELWAKLRPEEREGVRDLVVTQTFVREGTRGFVAGEGTPSHRGMPGASLRDAPPLRLASLDELPVIVAGCDVADVRREQLAPAGTYQAIAGLAGATAVALLVFTLLVLR